MASALVVTVGGTTLPDGIVSLSRSDETLWSEGTGRGASNGLMVGSVVAKKQTWSIQWGIITQAQYNAIRNAITGSFQTFVVQINGSNVANVTAYRSSIQGEFIGVHGGVAYWRNVSVEMIER